MTVLLQASYRGSKERQLLRTFEKATLPGGFFVFTARDYDEGQRISRDHSSEQEIIRNFGGVA